MGDSQATRNDFAFAILAKAGHTTGRFFDNQETAERIDGEAIGGLSVDGKDARLVSMGSMPGEQQYP